MGKVRSGNCSCGGSDAGNRLTCDCLPGNQNRECAHVCLKKGRAIHTFKTEYPLFVKVRASADITLKNGRVEAGTKGQILEIVSHGEMPRVKVYWDSGVNQGATCALFVDMLVLDRGCVVEEPLRNINGRAVRTQRHVASPSASGALPASSPYKSTTTPKKTQHAAEGSVGSDKKKRRLTL